MVGRRAMIGGLFSGMICGNTTYRPNFIEALKKTIESQECENGVAVITVAGGEVDRGYVTSVAELEEMMGSGIFISQFMDHEGTLHIQNVKIY